jgi:hypothetical protein
VIHWNRKVEFKQIRPVNNRTYSSLSRYGAAAARNRSAILKVYFLEERKYYF